MNRSASPTRRSPRTRATPRPTCTWSWPSTRGGEGAGTNRRDGASKRSQTISYPTRDGILMARWFFGLALALGLAALPVLAADKGERADKMEALKALND